jgi:hypothetical protein
LVGAAALVAITAFLVETVTSAFVTGVVGMTLERVDAVEQAHRVREAVNLAFTLPLGMALIFAVGFWSAWLLPVRNPHRWLAGVVIAWYSVRLALYPLALWYAANVLQVPLQRSFLETLLRALAFGALSFGFLLAGNFFGRHRYGATRRSVTREPSSPPAPTNPKPSTVGNPINERFDRDGHVID